MSCLFFCPGRTSSASLAEGEVPRSAGHGPAALRGGRGVILSISEGSRPRRRGGFPGAALQPARRHRDPSSAAPPQDDNALARTAPAEKRRNLRRNRTLRTDFAGDFCFILTSLHSRKRLQGSTPHPSFGSREIAECHLRLAGRRKTLRAYADPRVFLPPAAAACFSPQGEGFGGRRAHIRSRRSCGSGPNPGCRSSRRR